jgi:ribose transport system ATP-binding protein
MQGVSKTFGGIKALIDVDLDVERGEIHALLGGNGAGKSTILKILNGVHVPDSGRITVDGVALTEISPEASRRAGIAMIYQEMSLIPTLTVAQNVFLTREAKGNLGLIDDRTSERRARKLFHLLNVEIDPRAMVGDLGAGQRQLTEIIKGDFPAGQGPGPRRTLDRPFGGGCRASVRLPPQAQDRRRGDHLRLAPDG